VLEARDRVGGRVWSQPLVAGDPRTTIERGAEFILAGYDLMRQTADDLGLSIADTGMSYYVRKPSGGAATSHDAIAECANTVSTAAAKSPWGTPLTDVLAEVAPYVDAAALQAYVSRVAVTNACAEDRLSAAAVSDMTVLFEPRPSYRIAGGNQSVAIRLAERLGDAVMLRTPIHTVSWSANEVQLKTDVDELVVDAAVLAVPLAVARELSFDPVLPDWKMAAWERSGIGHAAKLHVPLLAPTTFGAVQSVPGRFWTWTATDESGEVQPVLHGFSGSGPALAALNVEAGAATWAERAAALRPDLALDVERAMVTTWSDDPWTREAYTALTIDVAAGDAELLPTAVGALHFAGEHTAGDWAGLMEGALRSGERAAAEITPLG
jgi:monoamine oxidase